MVIDKIVNTFMNLHTLTMKKLLLLIRISPIILLLIGVLTIVLWFRAGANRALKERVPGTDAVVESGSEIKLSAVLRGKLTKIGGMSVEMPGEWPRFRGENFDGIYNNDNIRLARRWGAGQPKITWGIDVGEGYAGAAVYKGRVYLLDYDAKSQMDVLRCIDLSTGSDIWRYSYPVKVKRNHGMSRTVPAVTDKYVISIGPKCHVLCLDSVTGEFRWGIDLVRDFNTMVPEWYAGQCPLIEGDRTIIAPGGYALMIAVDNATGKALWKTPNPNNWNMTHSSIMPMDFNGKRMYIYCASGGVVGVSALDGSILWETSEWKIGIATVPSPVIIGKDKIFLSGGYNAGCIMLQLRVSAGKIQARTLFRLKPDVFGSDQQTPIVYKNHIYGVRPDGQLTCLDFNGKVVWTSGAANRFGLGPYMVANGLIYVMDDNGLLRMAEATSDGYKELSQAQVLKGHDSWGPMAIADGKLILRDLTRIVCLDITG